MDTEKIEAYKKHEMLLKIVYHFGGGLMFVSHLERFMGYKHKTQLWRNLNELLDVGLIDKIKYHKHCIIKVKASAIKRIIQKNTVDSITVTGYKIQKSAMIGAVSNFYYPQYNDLYLYEEVKQRFDREHMDTQYLSKEIDKISQIKPSQRHTLKTFRNRNIYIERYGCKDDIFFIALSILDLTAEFNPGKMSRLIADVYSSYSDIFGNNLNIVMKNETSALCFYSLCF